MNKALTKLSLIALTLAAVSFQVSPASAGPTWVSINGGPPTLVTGQTTVNLGNGGTDVIQSNGSFLETFSASTPNIPMPNTWVNECNNGGGLPGYNGNNPLNNTGKPGDPCLDR